DAAAGKTTGNADLRQADKRVDPAVDAEGGGVQRIVRSEDNVDAVKTETGFVHEVGADDPRLVQRQQLALTVALIAAARVAVGIRVRWLITLVPLYRVIEIQRVFIGNDLADVRGALLDVHGRNCGGYELVCAGVHRGKQREQAANDGIARSLRLGDLSCGQRG